MLQWMGGSRRKVATSRKSIQKRQKQYFEQRKRQQQEHGVAFMETNTDGLVSDHHKGNRSLDVLSLLYVSKAAEECRRHCGNENTSAVSHKATSTRSSKGVDLTFPATHQPSRITPTSVNHEATARDHREPSIARSPSSHQMRTTTPGSSRRSTSNIRTTESGCHMNVSANQPSIFDLIGEDGTIGDSKGSPAHEAHVAFSIKGLGNIGTETPLQSPQRPERKSSEDHLSFNKAFKNSHPFQSFNAMLDDLGMEECLANTEKPNRENQLYSFPTSEDIHYPFNYVGPVESVPKDSVQLDTPFQMNSPHERDRHRSHWSADFRFLENDGSEKRCRLNRRNVNATDNPYPWRNDSPDLKFDGYNSPFRSSFPCNYGPQAGYSSIQKPWEDPRDTLTSLSEESCSSTAVRGEADVPSERHSRRLVKDPERPLKSSADEDYDDFVQHNRAATSMRQAEKCSGYRKYTRPNALYSKATYFSPVTLNERLVDEDPWQFDEEFLHSNKNSHPGSCCPSSEKEGDLFGNDEETAFLHSTKCYFGRGDEEDRVAEFSSENPSFWEPSYLGKQPLHEAFRKACSGESWFGVRHDFEIHVHSSLEDADLFGDKESAAPIPDLSAQGSATEEGGGHEPETKSQPPPTSENLVQVPPSAATVSKNLTSESWSCGDTNLKDSGNSLTGQKPREMMQQDTSAYSSNENVQERSFTVKTPHESQGRVIAEELLGTDPAKHQQDTKGIQTN